MGEFDLIRSLSRGIARKSTRVRCGIGDDCAVLRGTQTTDLLWTTDLLIEGRHFSLLYESLEEVGRKAMLVNLSDIAAMGGTPLYALVAIGLPSRFSVRNATQLFRGIKRVARTAGVHLVGGDTNRSSRLIISVTLLGEVEAGCALLRSGCRPGDGIYVTGRLGAAAVALRAGRFQEPPNRVAVGRQLVKRRWANACIDISDGFLADLGHLLEASRVGATVEIDRLPGRAPLPQKLTGGEDYELLFSAPASVKLPRKMSGVKIARVGKITRQRGRIDLVDSEGRRRPLPQRRGFTHF